MNDYEQRQLDIKSGEVLDRLAARNKHVAEPLRSIANAFSADIPPSPQIDAAELIAALKAASGYLMNAKIDLETGAPKRTAIRTIDGGLNMIRAALRKAGME